MLLKQLIRGLFSPQKTATAPDDYARAAALYAQQQYAQAAAVCRTIIGKNPSAADTLHLHGLCLYRLKDFAAANQALRAAIDATPEDADLHMSMAMVLRDAGSDKRAIAHCRRALELWPEFPPATLTLAQLLDRSGDTDGAIAGYEQAVAQQPDLREIHERLFALYHEQARESEATAKLHLLLLRWPDDGLRIRAALRVPPFSDSIDQIQDLRLGIQQRIDALLAEKTLTVADPIREIGVTPFYLAFHGLNDRALTTSMAALIKRACPDRQLRNSFKRGSGRIRIAFVSRYFYAHSIGRLSLGVMRHLPRDKFDVTVYALEQRLDPVADAIRSAADHYVDCSRSSLRETEAIIAQQAQDILFFTDIGMDPRSYFLAYSRLAPVQCATWGHPDTTGIDSIDHFISAEGIDTADAADHYSENLVRLKSFFLHDYEKPECSGDLKSAEHYGIFPDRHIYLCTQSLFKIHPDFEAAMAGILRNDGNGEIILLEGMHRHWGERLRQRYARNMPDVAARIRFLPRMPWQDLLSLTTHADVCLDTFHFGGGNTTCEALAMGTPVVALPSPYLRGRLTLGCYQQMDMHDCIAATPEQYVNIANRLAQDQAWRAEVAAKINVSVDSLFNQCTGIAELALFLEQALENAPLLH